MRLEPRPAVRVLRGVPRRAVPHEAVARARRAVLAAPAPLRVLNLRRATHLPHRTPRPRHLAKALADLRAARERVLVLAAAVRKAPRVARHRPGGVPAHGPPRHLGVRVEKTRRVQSRLPGGPEPRRRVAPRALAPLVRAPLPSQNRLAGNTHGHLALADLRPGRVRERVVYGFSVVVRVVGVVGVVGSEGRQRARRGRVGVGGEIRRLDPPANLGVRLEVPAGSVHLRGARVPEAHARRARTVPALVRAPVPRERRGGRRREALAPRPREILGATKRDVAARRPSDERRAVVRAVRVRRADQVRAGTRARPRGVSSLRRRFRFRCRGERRAVARLAAVGAVPPRQRLGDVALTKLVRVEARERVAAVERARDARHLGAGDLLHRPPAHLGVRREPRAVVREVVRLPGVAVAHLAEARAVAALGGAKRPLRARPGRGSQRREREREERAREAHRANPGERGRRAEANRSGLLTKVEGEEGEGGSAGGSGREKKPPETEPGRGESGMKKTRSSTTGAGTARGRAMRERRTSDDEPSARRVRRPRARAGEERAEGGATQAFAGTVRQHPGRSGRRTMSIKDVMMSRTGQIQNFRRRGRAAVS